MVHSSNWLGLQIFSLPTRVRIPDEPLNATVINRGNDPDRKSEKVGSTPTGGTNKFEYAEELEILSGL